MSDITDCIFCKIALEKDSNTELLYKDDTLVVFRDIRPATPHHYLVVTKEHIPDSKQLKQEHLALVERMTEAGKQVLEKQGADINDTRMGFHWPPFHMVHHLHMHVIGSAKQMGWIAQGLFLPKSFWFVTVDWLLDRLKRMSKKSRC